MISSLQAAGEVTETSAMGDVELGLARTCYSCAPCQEHSRSSTVHGDTDCLVAQLRRCRSSPAVLGCRARSPDPALDESTDDTGQERVTRQQTYPSALGSPYQRVLAPRSHQWLQHHADAGERLVRLATQLLPLRARSRCSSLPNLKLAAEVHSSPLPEDVRLVPPPRASSEDLTARLAEEGSEPRTEPSVPLFSAPEDTVIIFDWDDTLFPTWFITKVVLPSNPSGQSKEVPLSEDSPFFDALRRHAEAVRTLLTAAKAVGRVGIVTLSQRPWVLSSAARYLPGVDFEMVLKELEIPVVYARECIRRPMIVKAGVEEGVNLFTIAKQAAMLKALKKLYGKSPWKNVLSIGDSIVERDAITEVLWSRDEDLGRATCCKTVKLMEDPSLEQLGAQLQLLGMWLRSMAAHGQDFDVVMDDSEETMLRMHKQFCS